MAAIARTYTVALLLASAAVVSAVTNCAHTMSDGARYDLSSLAGPDLPSADASYNYLLQVCGTSQDTTCAAQGGSFCQYTTAIPPAYQHVLSKWDATGTWTSCPAAMCPNGGVQLYFANGDRCGGSGPYRAVTYVINCPASGEASSTAYVVGTQGCIYTVTLTHTAGCPIDAPGSGADDIGALTRAQFIGAVVAAGVVVLALLAWSIACCAKGSCLCCGCCGCDVSSVPAHGTNALGMTTTAPVGGAQPPVAVVVVQRQ